MGSKGRFVALCATVGILATMLVAPSAHAADNSCWDYRKAERGFARRINQAREDEGLRKLSLDPELSKVARVHSREMVRATSLHHTSSDKLAKRVTDWLMLGENVGLGDRVGSLHQAFMDSPAHRDNVLEAAYRHIGVGTIRKNGRLWVTIVFEAVSDPGTTLRMPRC